MRSTRPLRCKYSIRVAVTLRHAVSSWHTMDVSKGYVHDHARPDAPAYGVAQVEPWPRHCWRLSFLHSDFLRGNAASLGLGDTVATVRGAADHRGRISPHLRCPAARPIATRTGGNVSEQLLKQLGIDQQILQQLSINRRRSPRPERLGTGPATRKCGSVFLGACVPGERRVHRRAAVSAAPALAAPATDSR